MQKRSKMIIAGLVALGLAGSAVAYGKHSGHKNHGERLVNKLTSTLELNETQQTELSEFVTSMKESRQQFRRGGRPDLGSLLGLLDDTQLDQEKAMTMIREHFDQMEQQAQTLLASAAEFTNSLSDEQREQLKTIAQERMEKRKQRHERRMRGGDNEDS